MSVLLALVLVVIDDGLSGAEVKGVVSQHAHEVKACYEHGLKKQPKLFGRVVVHFVIGPTGALSDAVLDESTLGAPDVELCIVSAAKKWKFPKPRGGGEVQVNLPFMLRPADDDENDVALGLIEPPPADEEEPALAAEPEAKPAPLVFHERDMNLAEQWEAGGSGMYPVALGLLLVVGLGALAVLLALMKQAKAALLVAGLCWGAAGFSASMGVLGYVNGLLGSKRALMMVNPTDRDYIEKTAVQEAKVPMKFGAAVGGLGALAGAAAAGVVLSRRRREPDGG